MQTERDGNNIHSTPNNSESDSQQKNLLVKIERLRVRKNKLKNTLRSLMTQCNSYIEEIDKLKIENKSLTLQNESLKNNLSKIGQKLNDLDTALFQQSSSYENRLKYIIDEKDATEKELDQLSKRNIKLQRYLTNAQRDLKALGDALEYEIKPIARKFGKGKDGDNSLYERMNKLLDYLETKQRNIAAILLQINYDSELRKTIDQQQHVLKTQEKFEQQTLESNRQRMASFYFLAALSGLTSLYMISYAIAGKSFKLGKFGHGIFIFFINVYRYSFNFSKAV